MVTENKHTSAARLSIHITPEKVYSMLSPAVFLPGNSSRFDFTAARTACALSLSAEDKRELGDNLSALGYGDIVFYDDMGFCIASRTRGNTLETAVVIRGTQGNEWYSNFEVGYSAEHSGFSKTADFIELRLSDYLFTRAIGTQPSFFVTGCSRGGAVANILSKRLCERYGTDRVWGYTIASPRVTISRNVTRFNCVFNLIRDEDFFTRLPLEGWGYQRYGRDITLKTADDFTERFGLISGEEYIGYVSPQPVDTILCSMIKLAPNVHAYYERRRQVGDRKMSLYEFLNSVADILSDNTDESSADIFVSAMVSDYADLLSFLSDGADLYELIGSANGALRCSVADSHSPCAYIAALEGSRL